MHTIQELTKKVKACDASLSTSRSQIDTLTTTLRDADKTRLELNQSLTVQVDELTNQVIRLEDENRELQYQLKDVQFNQSLSSSSSSSSSSSTSRVNNNNMMSESDKQWFEHMILSDSLSETSHLKQLQHDLSTATSTRANADHDNDKDEIQILLSNLLNSLQLQSASESTSNSSNPNPPPPHPSSMLSRSLSQLNYHSSSGTTSSGAGGGGVNTTSSFNLLTQVKSLINDVYGKYTSLQKQYHVVDLMNQSNSCTVSILQSRLKSALTQLSALKTRHDATTALLGDDSKGSQSAKDTALSTVKRLLLTERLKTKLLHNNLLTEQRKHCLLRAERKQDSLQIKKLQSIIADLEVKLTSDSHTNTVTAREEALQIYADSLNKMEEKFYNYINTQLPRLVSGLPILESSLSEFPFEHTRFPYDSNRAATSTSTNTSNNSNKKGNIHQWKDPASVSSSHRLQITEKVTQELGLDRHYALAESLCQAQAVQSVQNTKIHQLTEKNMILKERNYQLEHIVSTWKRDIENETETNKSVELLSSMNNISSSSAIAGSGGVMIANHHQSQLHQLTEQITTLTGKLHQYEEENLTLKTTQNSQEEKYHHLQHLYNMMSQQEQQTKSQLSANIVKLRVFLEKQYVQELARLRSSYESEKKSLYDEIEEIASQEVYVDDEEEDEDEKEESSHHFYLSQQPSYSAPSPLSALPLAPPLKQSIVEPSSPPLRPPSSANAAATILTSTHSNNTSTMKTNKKMKKSSSQSATLTKPPRPRPAANTKPPVITAPNPAGSNSHSRGGSGHNSPSSINKHNQSNSPSYNNSDNTNSTNAVLTDADIEAMKDVSQLQRQLRVEISRHSQAQNTVSIVGIIIIYLYNCLFVYV